MDIKKAKAAYVHRYTMEHVPAWAMQPAPNGKYYAPQYRSDAEWFENTAFPPNNPLATSANDTSCYSSGQTWPVGQWLDAPFSKHHTVSGVVPDRETFELIVRWGDVQDADEPREASVYTFETAAQRDAFRDGIIAARPEGRGYDFYTRDSDGSIPPDEEWAELYGED